MYICVCVCTRRLSLLISAELRLSAMQQHNAFTVHSDLLIFFPQKYLSLSQVQKYPSLLSIA